MYEKSWIQVSIVNSSKERRTVMIKVNLMPKNTKHIIARALDQRIDLTNLVERVSQLEFKMRNLEKHIETSKDDYIDRIAINKLQSILRSSPELTNQLEMDPDLLKLADELTKEVEL